MIRHHQHDDDSYSIIRTNIPKDRLCAKQIYLLYRIRWSIELFNKANKQSSCLQSINSANKNIILIFLLLSLLVSIIKTYCGHKARFEYKILKELLDDIALNARRSKPSNRDRVLLKDLPLLIWQIVNHPRPDRKVA